MIHARFSDHRTLGSGNEVFTLLGRGGPFGSVTWIIYTS